MCPLDTQDGIERKEQGHIMCPLDTQDGTHSEKRTKEEGLYRMSLKLRKEHVSQS